MVEEPQVQLGCGFPRPTGRGEPVNERLGVNDRFRPESGDDELAPQLSFLAVEWEGLAAASENVWRRSRMSKGKSERKASSGVGTRMFAPAALAAGITPSSRNRLTWSHAAGTLGLPVVYGGFANHTQPPLSSDSRGRSILRVRLRRRKESCRGRTSRDPCLTIDM